MGEKQILFIGAGRMATAIAGGMVKKGFAAKNLKAYDVSSAAAAEFTKVTGVAACTSGVAELVAAADVALLAVKPQYLAEALAPVDLSEKLVISILAGIPLKRLFELTGSSRLVRVMPNTPALVGEGASVYTMYQPLEEAETALVLSILESMGTVDALPEHLFDAVTGLSGSGPAYVLELIQALADSGVMLGLPRNVALRLSAQTVFGSAKLQMVTQTHPIVLRDQVISPGGTTAQGVAALDEGAFRAVIARAVAQAAARSAELGNVK